MRVFSTNTHIRNSFGGYCVGILIFAGAFTQGCVATAPGPSTMQFSWIDCNGATSPYFSVSVSTDGGARYVGGARTKVTDSRELHLTPASANELIRAGKKIARQTANSNAPAVHKTAAAESPYCLRVQTSATGAMSRVRLSDSRAKAFNRLADDSFHFKQLVCPGRFGFLAGDNACEQPLIRYTFGREPPCNETQWLLIYPSGDILRPAGRDEKQDRYFNMQPANALDLARTAVRFEVIGNESENQYGAFPRFVRGTKSEQLDFISRLERLTGASWDKLSEAASSCSAEYLNYVPYQGVLVYEDTLSALTGNRKR